MNEIEKYNANLFSKYDNFKTHDRETTESSQLSDDQKDLVSTALNGTFVNPKFKMKYFVTSGQITPYSTIKQYMLELKAIEESFENYERGIKKLGLEIELLELKLAEETNAVKLTEMKIELTDKEYHFRQNKRRIQQLHIEREQWIELIEEFNASPQGMLADGRPLMSVLGTPEEDIHEREYWMVRLARQAAMDLSAYGRISAGNLDAIYQMPQEMMVQSLALAHEMSLKAENLSNLLRNEMQNDLEKNDPQFKISHTIEETPDNKNNGDDPNQPGLLDVYRT